MSEPLAYERDAYLRSLQTRVVAEGKDQRGFWVVLEDTIFYPEGGGQPSDTGTIAGVSVIAVEKTPHGVKHYTAAPVLQGDVALRLDWERRFDHMQHHTGQHLLSAVAEDRFGYKTKAFHLGRELCDVELDVKQLPQEQLKAIEEEVAQEIRAARPIRAHYLAPEELTRFRWIRSRGLPEGHAGLVRLVEIDGVDMATCGGTHLKNTAEIEALALVTTEPMRGGTRVYFVAGQRLRERLHLHEKRNASLRSLLGAADQDLPSQALAKLQQLEEVTRQLRRTQEELSRLLGEKLAAHGDQLVSWHEAGADLSFLQQTARAFLEIRPQGFLFLTGGQETDGCFLLASHRPDLPQIGQQVCQLLKGRGGGSRTLFQGKSCHLQRRDQVVRFLHETLGKPET